MNITRGAAPIAAILSLLATSAIAADMRAPVARAPVMVAPAPPSWTGFYLGGSVGARWADAQETTLSVGGAAPAGVSPVTGTYDNTAFRAGVYGGYNWQVAPMWLVGIEGDWAWADQSTTLSRLPGAAAINAGDASTFQQNWDASVRGRLGVLVTPTALLYVTGGWSWQNVDTTAVCSAATCGAALTTTNSFTRNGWTIGGGIEWMFAPNWLARGEYRYADYGDTTLNYLGGANATVANGSLTTSTAIFGLAYKF